MPVHTETELSLMRLENSKLRQCNQQIQELDDAEIDRYMVAQVVTPTAAGVCCVNCSNQFDWYILESDNTPARLHRLGSSQLPD